MTSKFSKSIVGLSDTCETMIKVIEATKKKETNSTRRNPFVCVKVYKSSIFLNG